MRNGEHAIGLFQGMFEKNTLTFKADEATTGPASFVAVDPGGNPILVDQHV